ncbi:MAG: phenylacetate--CoA ligase family protein, partial [Chloroflexi bacterium]|nr:phenylacetate--CoA ligase family protein [Chloroflexota bacterium]
CTPTYALRLAEVAREHGLDLRASPIRATIHAGEPGASIPATRQRIEEAWGATCFDHTGMSEIGATGYTCVAQAGVHLIESEYIVEVVNPETGEPVPEGQEGELVLTNLGRWGMPLLRYHSGDRVQLTTERCECGRTNARMLGGILGRADDMVIVRGVNVFPGSIEGVVRQYAEIDEFRIEIAAERQMKELRLAVEIDAQRHGQEAVERVLAALGEELHRTLSLRVPCRAVPAGSLPRFELKARRVMHLE